MELVRYIRDHWGWLGQLPESIDFSYAYLDIHLPIWCYPSLQICIFIWYLQYRYTLFGTDDQMSIFNRNKWPQAPLDAGSFWGSPRPVSTLDRWLLSLAAWYTSIVVSMLYHVVSIFIMWMVLWWLYDVIFTYHIFNIYSLLFTRVAYMTTHLGVRWTKNDLICKLIAACVGRVDLPWHRSKSNRNLKFVLSYP